jgi:fatty-acyl-CoA synthase
MIVPARSGTAPGSEPAALDISGWIAHWAQWTPGQTALRFEGRCVSPGEMALTAGKPVLYHRVRIVDAAGTDVAAGEPGEVWIRGRSVMQGYWENPQATREAFRDGWFRNGDLGRFDEEGYLHIVDRIKDIIIVGSSNVYPSDLETVLGDCADICEAAVVGRRDDRLGEVPVACVVPVPGRSLTKEQVIALFDGRLATYKHPRDVIFLDALPRNAAGKVQKTVLRDLVSKAGGRGRAPRPVRYQREFPSWHSGAGG